MKTAWKGMLNIGPLLVLPVRLYRATKEEEYAFRQVHEADGGKIRYRRFCEECGQEVQFPDIGKAVEVGDRLITFTQEELDSLPQAEKAISVGLFITAGVVDITTFGNAYFIVPDDAGVRAYTLLRQALKDKQQVAVAQFAMSGRDALALIYPLGKMLILQRACWPSEARKPDFQFLNQEVKVTARERKLTGMLVDAMSGIWEPENYSSDWLRARNQIVEARLAGSPPPPRTPAQQAATEDIGAVLRASIAAAKKKREKEGQPA